MVKKNRCRSGRKNMKLVLISGDMSVWRGLCSDEWKVESAETIRQEKGNRSDII